MVRICVAGGTGEAGREVVRQALGLGHTVAVLTRNPPLAGTREYYDGASYFRADVTTGEGLPEALAGADVVVDCLEARTGKALRHYAAGGALLLGEAAAAGVARAVQLSIVNCDQSTLAYYRSKADKERVYARSPLDTRTVRATQFHSLLAGIFGAGSRLGLVPVIKGARFQTISPADVGSALLEAALGPPSGDSHTVQTVGGPEVLGMGSLAGAWKRVTGARGLVTELPLPGSTGRFLREGKNLAPEQRYGHATFESWLANRQENL
ncbi:SDR family oxidoreductase [Arthrobacter globiformis]|uniref:NmrA family transcriptional regulator n=1 Tax=Arthrobacter globiformis TaxID=1665 RepID=A0A328HD72_ARTGO|nr:NAD(P)H-binding protein [Arthrobacter globiformis]RAM36114.1 NmrA family transcriptional regulator [Arthrobacter globiformis]